MGSESPRSNVALHLRALALDGAADTGCGGGAALPRQPPHPDASPAEIPAPRRRQDDPPPHPDRPDSDERMNDTEPATRKQTMARPVIIEPPSAEAAAPHLLPEEEPATRRKRTTKKRAKNPTTTISSNRTAKKAKKAAKRKAATQQPDADSADEREIVDPLRASLTWQEDEITVYDPEDADDDGEGMDGVGFQPPPGLARVTAKRKLGQLAAYRRMVEQEAREGRRRRRGRAEDEKERVTRVQFSEGETVIEVV